MKKYSQSITAIIVAVVFIVSALASAPAKQVADTRYNGVFNVNAQKDEDVTNSAKLAFLKTTPNPSIVLRVPTVTSEVTQEDNSIKTTKNNDGTNNINDINVYNVIEKELLKGGFTVRDRALFEKVLGDKSVNDYSRIKELTETDLILELSSIEFVKFPMNSFVFYTKSKRKGTIENRVNCTNYFDMYGLKLEFRLIKVKDNDFIGSFTYNYNPCANAPCDYNINVSAQNACSVPFLQQGNAVVSGTNLISQEEIENFVKSSTHKLVQAIYVNR